MINFDASIPVRVAGRRGLSCNLLRYELVYIHLIKPD